MEVPELEEYNIIIIPKEPEEASPTGSPIDYEDPSQVRDLVAEHLAKIFIATHRKKIKKEIDNAKPKCK